MFLLHLLIAEYSTERELLTSLQNGTVDKVWMFGCQANHKEISPDFTIVSVLDDDFMWQKPTIGVRVQFLNRSYFDQNFTECLEMDGDDDDNDRDDDDDNLFWKQDVRKHCLILLTSLLFPSEFLSYLLSPNVSPIHSHHRKVTKGLDCQNRTFK